MGLKVTFELLEETPFRISMQSDVESGSLDLSHVHAAELRHMEVETLCGTGVSEVLSMNKTNKSVTCPHCINLLERREKFTKRNGKWY